MIYPTPVSTGVANTCCGHQVCYSALHTNLILELCIKHLFQDLLKFFRISQFLDLQPKKTNIYRYTQTEDLLYTAEKEPEDKHKHLEFCTCIFSCCLHQMFFNLQSNRQGWQNIQALLDAFC